MAHVQGLVAARRVATSARLRAYPGDLIRATMNAMRDDESLKNQLPYPYNQDLSKVLTHLNRRTPFVRERLANDPVTAAYIAAAMRLVSRHLGPDPERIPADPRDENSVARPVFGFISQRAVADEVANNPDPFPRQGNVSTMRSTWASHSDFIADLLNFAFSQGWGYYADGISDELAACAERLVDGPDVTQAAHDLAYLNVAITGNTPSIRLTHVAMSTADGDKAISDAIADSVEARLTPWKAVYAEFIEARGLRLRPGLTIDDIANVLKAVIDGVVLRIAADPSPALVDHDRKRTVVGKAALAVIYSFCEPAKSASGLTLEQAVHEMIHGPCDDQEPVA